LVFSKNTGKSYGGSVRNAMKAHLNYLLSHDVLESSFSKEDINRIVDEAMEYTKKRWDAVTSGKLMVTLPNDF